MDENQAPDTSEIDASEKPFRGNRALTVAVLILFVIVFAVAMVIDVAFLPIFVPTFGYGFCWFRNFRKKMSFDALAYPYALGFMGYGLLAVLYEMIVSLILNSIWPHDSSLSRNYITSNFIYSLLGAALATEVARYLSAKKIRDDRQEDDVNLYLFNSMAGNLGITTFILLLSNTGNLLKRVDVTKLATSKALANAVLVKSFLDVPLQLLLGYRLSVTILRFGFYNHENLSWNLVLLGNILIRALTEALFFFLGIITQWGAGLLAANYLLFLLIVGLILRRERRSLSFSFDKNIEEKHVAPTSSAPNVPAPVEAEAK